MSNWRRYRSLKVSVTLLAILVAGSALSQQALQPHQTEILDALTLLVRCTHAAADKAEMPEGKLTPDAFRNSYLKWCSETEKDYLTKMIGDPDDPNIRAQKTARGAALINRMLTVIFRTKMMEKDRR